MPHQCTECGYTFPDGSKEMLSGCPDCGGNKFQYHPGAVPDDPAETDETPPERPDSVSGAMGRAADTVRDVFGGDSETPDADEPDPPTPDSRTPADGERKHPGENTGESAEDGPTDWPDPDGAAERAAGASDSPPAGADDTLPEAGDDTDSTPPEIEGVEDRAQADARSQVVDEEDLPDPSELGDANDPTDVGPPPGAPDDSPSGADDPVSSRTEGAEPEAEIADTPDGEQPELSELREELNDQFESIRIVEPGQYELNLMELYDRDQYIIALQEDGRYVIEVPESWRDS